MKIVTRKKSFKQTFSIFDKSSSFTVCVIHRFCPLIHLLHCQSVNVYCSNFNKTGRLISRQSFHLITTTVSLNLFSSNMQKKSYFQKVCFQTHFLSETFLFSLLFSSSFIARTNFDCRVRHLLTMRSFEDINILNFAAVVKNEFYKCVFKIIHQLNYFVSVRSFHREVKQVIALRSSHDIHI